MEEAPSLKLVILQGPREGETLNFRPGSAIRIGRVLRGNTLPIKDPGISSKHLTILTESGKWVLRDLDSSNGTVLDGSKVSPNTPLDIHDGSTIKIGENTSIRVTFECVSQTELGPENDDSVVPVPRPVRGRRRKVQIQSIDENASVNGGDESGFVGRPTRNSKNKQSVTTVSDLNALEPKNKRVTRNSKKKPAVVEISDSSVVNSDAPEEKVEDPIKHTLVTQNSSVVVDNPQNTSLQCEVENVEKKKTRGGARKKKLNEDFAVDDGGVKETCDEKEKENLNDEREKGNLNDDGSWNDLEKMRLGEWFDFLEVHLPKQIIDETEEMFDSMREKAERLREYIMMQKDHKVEMPLED